MFEDCVESTVMGNLKESKKCRHAYFPNHPHVSQRAPCGSLLLNVKGYSGYYTTQSVSIQATTTINQQVVKRAGFIQKCEQWRSCTVPEGYLCDI